MQDEIKGIICKICDKKFMMRQTFLNFQETVDQQDVLLEKHLKLEREKASTLSSTKSTLASREDELNGLTARTEQSA